MSDISRKHTPGPWKRDDETIYALTDHPTRGGIQTNIFFAGFQTSMQLCSPEELIANARLAQAAPELLGALHNLLENVDFYDRNGVLDQKCFKADRENAREVAISAISKAEGVKP